MRWLIYTLFIMVCWLGVWDGNMAMGFSVDNITERPYDKKADEQGEEALDYGKMNKEDALDDETVSERIQQEYKIDYDAPRNQRATFYVKEGINRFLAIAGLVALAVLIYGFYKMLATGDNDKAYGEARKIVIGAITALLIIGFVWFIVSWFFEIFFKVKEGVAGAD